MVFIHAYSNLFLYLFSIMVVQYYRIKRAWNTANIQYVALNFLYLTRNVSWLTALYLPLDSWLHDRLTDCLTDWLFDIMIDYLGTDYIQYLHTVVLKLHDYFTDCLSDWYPNVFVIFFMYGWIKRRRTNNYMICICI